MIYGAIVQLPRTRLGPKAAIQQSHSRVMIPAILSGRGAVSPGIPTDRCSVTGRPREVARCFTTEMSQEGRGTSLYIVYTPLVMRPLGNAPSKTAEDGAFGVSGY